MELLKVDTLDDAKARLWEKVCEAGIEPNTEEVGLLDSYDRILAEDVKSEADIPAFDRSTVDGYAVLASDTNGASENIPAFLDLLEETEIGTVPSKSIKHGTCSYVPTGGMLPEGADAMVMVEYTENFGDGMIAVSSSVAEGWNVVKRGEDAKVGDVVLTRGTRIGQAQMGVLAAAGIRTVKVCKPLSIYIFSTGDELSAPGEVLPYGKVYDINGYGVAAAAKKLGLTVAGLELLPDDKETIRSHMKAAMEKADIIITSGGSSKGKKDMTGIIMDELTEGGLFLHGLAIKPGKPTLLAVHKSEHKLFVGLPGHPAAALMVFGQVVGWLWRRFTGEQEKVMAAARISVNLPAAPGRETLVPVKLTKLADAAENGLVASPVHGRSGLITPLAEADGYIIIGRNCEGVKAGEMVYVYAL